MGWEGGCRGQESGGCHGHAQHGKFWILLLGLVGKAAWIYKSEGKEGVLTDVLSWLHSQGWKQVFVGKTVGKTIKLSEVRKCPQGLRQHSEAGGFSRTHSSAGSQLHEGEVSSVRTEQRAGLGEGHTQGPGSSSSSSEGNRVLDACSCHSKVLQTEQLKTVRIYSPTVLEPRSLKSQYP